MPVQGMVNQKSQFMWEVTPGTNPAANAKQPLSFSLKPMDKTELQRYRPEGIRFDTLSLYNKEWSAFKFDGVPSFTEQLWLYAWSLVVPVTTTPGGATLARQHLGNPSSSGPNTRKTATIERGDGTYAERTSYNVIDSLQFSFSRSEHKVSGAGFGGRLYDSTNDAVVKTASPTSVAEKPMSALSWQVYIANSQAGLDAATALDLPFKVDWGITNLAGPVFGGNGLPGFGAVVELLPQGTAKLRLAVDATSLNFRDNLRSGDKLFMRIEHTGAEIEAGQDYYHSLDTALMVSDAFGEPSDDQGALAVDIPFVFAHDGTWAQAIQYKLINALTAV